MTKKTYVLDKNEIAFATLINATFAGVNYGIEKLGNGKGLTKKDILKYLKELMVNANVALSSEYLRGELIKKDLIENDPSIFCSYDPSEDNPDHLVEVVFKD